MGGARRLLLDGVEITNPDKILYPAHGITKGDVARYYQKAASRMMPYLANRIISEVRCPEGVDSACFFRRHPSHNSEGVVSIPVHSASGETETYFYLADSRGLLGEVQMDTIEFHTWISQVQTLENPDTIVFDLDPDEGMPLKRIRQGVRDVKDILDSLLLKSYLKTSGGKGYHIVAPIKPTVSWDAVHAFSQQVARTMESTWPDRYTSNARKDQRNGRIFVDWLRNTRSATSVAPYSVRARDIAPVSMPIAWDELDVIEPQGITMAMALNRLGQTDPWSGFFSQSQALRT